MDGSGTDGDWATIATLDEVHLEVVREVMEDAGIAVRFVPVQPRFQGDVPPMVARPMVEVSVESARRAEAAALLADFSRSGADAAEAEAEAGVAPDDDSAERGPLWRRAIRWLKGEPPTGG